MAKILTDDTGKAMVVELEKISGYMENTQGTLDQLHTADKTSLVSAINELHDVYKVFKVLKEGSGAGLHNSIFRGKNLGSAVTGAQWSAIASGTFDDLWIGDFWHIGGVNWRIADFDYFYRTGDQGSGCLTHHVMIVPDTALYNARMNATNTTEGGYMGSEMYTTNLEQAKTQIDTAFGAGHILKHREFFPNAFTGYKPTGAIWVDSTVELMTEHMCCGARFFGVPHDPAVEPPLYVHTASMTQFSLFRLQRDLLITPNRAWYWLRDVVSASRFAYCTQGGVGTYIASVVGGVRPAFPIAA